MHPYEIRVGLGRRVRTLVVRTVATVVVLSVVAGCGVAVFEDRNPVDRLLSFGGIGVIVLLAAAAHLVGFFTGNRPELIVEAAGIRLGPAKVPWPSIRQIVLNPPAVGIRLRPGAPLPDGVTAVVHDPHRPQAVHVRHRLPPGRLDDRRLAAAVRAFAPPDVDVVAEDVPTAPPRPTARGRLDAPAVVTAVRMRDHSSTRSTHYRYKPYPVVSFAVPDGRHVIAETRKPGPGQPGTQVVVSYAADDPTDVHIHGKPPKSTIRWTSY